MDFYIFLSFILFFVWSLSFPMSKYLLLYSVSPLFFISMRMLIGGLSLLIFSIFKKPIPKFSKNSWIGLLGLSILGIFLANILENWSLRHISTTKTCFLYSLSPFLTAFLSYCHFKEKMSIGKWLGLALGCSGFSVIFFIKTGNENHWNFFWHFTWPEMSMLATVFFSVYGWIFLRILVKEENFSLLFVNGITMCIGGLFLFFYSLFTEGSSHIITIMQNSNWNIWTLLLSFTLLSNIICYNLYGFLLKKHSTTFLSLMGLLSPFFTSIYGWLFFREPISWAILFSSCIVLSGLWIFYQEEQRESLIASHR